MHIGDEMEIKEENKSDLRFEQEDDAVWVFSGDSHQFTEITRLIMSHIDDYNEDDVRLICHYAANEIDRLRAKLAKATPEGFVLVPREPTQDMMIAALAVISTGIGKDHIDVEIIQCWKKMIEAQEQSHD